MGHGRQLVTLGLLLALGQSAGAQAPAAETESWELQGDRWRAVDTPAPAPAVTASEPVLDRAEALIASNQPMAARKLLVPWLRDHRIHPLRDRAIFLIAEAYFDYGDRIRAFYHYDELMDYHPDSPLFVRALQRQYDIADAYLGGYKMRFLRVPMFSAENEGIEMLFRVQARSPGSPLAEAALRRTADYYFATGDFDLAADAYAVYSSSYPRSPLIPRVRLRQAFASYATFRGVRFDATPLLDARTQLRNIMQAYPQLAQEENLSEFIVQIDRELARKLIVTGDYYRRTKKPVAAVYYWRSALQIFPETPEAHDARERLDRAPAYALESAPPPEDGFAPNMNSPLLR